MKLSDDDIRRLAVAAYRAHCFQEVADIPAIEDTEQYESSAYGRLFLQSWGAVVRTIAKGLEQLAEEKANPK